MMTEQREIRSQKGTGYQGFGSDERLMTEDQWRVWRERLLGYIRLRVAPESAEDILQDVLLKALQKIGTLKDETKLSSWLYQITRNAIVDHYRGRVPTESFVDAEALSEENDALYPERILAECLQPMIGLLPEKYRNAIYLSEIEGKRQGEIAESEGISLSGAKSRVQRGRGMLKEMLLDCCRIELNGRGEVTDHCSHDECTSC